MEPILLFTMLALAANKIVAVIKGLVAGDRNLAVTQIVVWATALGVLLLAANAEVTSSVLLPFSPTPLGDLDLGSLLVAALIAGSTGSVIYDFKTAIDAGDSAREPRLLQSDHY